jgi:hypothetical protein
VRGRQKSPAGRERGLGKAGFLLKRPGEVCGGDFCGAEPMEKRGEEPHHRCTKIAPGTKCRACAVFYPPVLMRRPLGKAALRQR